MADVLDEKTNDELILDIVKLKEVYDKMKTYSLQLDLKLDRSINREKRLQVDHQKQVMQAETLNMMTKYQFVFTKIEASVKTVLNSNKMRELRMKQKAFDRFRGNAVAANRRINVNS